MRWVNSRCLASPRILVPLLQILHKGYCGIEVITVVEIVIVSLRLTHAHPRYDRIVYFAVQIVAANISFFILYALHIPMATTLLSF